MNTIRIGGVDEAFNIPWQKVCENSIISSALNHHLNFSIYSGGTGQLMRALNSNEIDIAIVLTEGAIFDIIKNNTSTILSHFVTSPLEWGIHVSNNSGINKIEDIKGKTIAISRFGSGSHLMPLLMANELGWNLANLKFHESMHLEGGLQDLKNNIAQVFFWEKHTTSPYLENNNLKYIGSYFSKWPAFSIVISKSTDATKVDIYKKVISEVLVAANNFKNDINSINQISTHYQMQNDLATAWLNATSWSNKVEVEISYIEKIIEALTKCNLLDEKASAVNCVSK